MQYLGQNRLGRLAIFFSLHITVATVVVLFNVDFISKLNPKISKKGNP